MKTIRSLMRLSLSGVVIVSVLISISCLRKKVVDSNSEPTPTPTEVSGEMTTDTTWTVGGSPYIVVDDVTVLEDVTLTIEPGVTVKLDSAKSIIVRGTLIAIGSSAENRDIRFTPSDTSLWLNLRGHGIKFGGSKSGGILQWCTIDSLDESVVGDSSSLTIIGNKINKSCVGVMLSYSSAKIVDNLITENMFGVVIESSSCEITGNSIVDNHVARGSVGVICRGSPPPTIHYNNIYGSGRDELSCTINEGDTLDATYNWWGTTEDWIISSRIENRGKGVVLYEPWLTSPWEGTTGVGKNDGR